jgi:hypothetical protein
MPSSSADQTGGATDDPPTGGNSDPMPRSTNEPADCQPGDPGCGDDPPADGGAATQCPNGCLIGGVCYSDGEVNADNNCQQCDATASSTEWSNDDGKSCNDDRFCTVDSIAKKSQNPSKTGDLGFVPYLQGLFLCVLGVLCGS